MSKLTRAALLALMLALLPAFAFGQASYPNRPIRMIVPFAPGGASDFVARILSPKLSELLGQQIVVDNRPGASGNIGMELAAKAPADGYTIYLGNIGTIAINPAIFANLALNPRRTSSRSRWSPTCRASLSPTQASRRTASPNSWRSRNRSRASSTSAHRDRAR